MERDLKDLFEALGETADTDAARLPGAQTLRQRTDRRTRLFTVVACVVAAAVVGVASIAARPLFVGEGPPIGAVPPGEIPDSAFLVLPPDMVVVSEPFTDFVPPTPEPTPPSDVCGLDIYTGNMEIHQRSRFGEFRQPPETRSSGGLVQAIGVYDNGDAARIMADVRTAFGGDGCSIAITGGDVIYRIVDAEPRGDESILVEVSYPENGTGYNWIVRFGDVISTVAVIPDREEITVDRATVDELTDLAEQAVRAWLN